ncbi:MAG TPA: hypothetical protein VNZ01_05100 [Solirubrobacteraceae bacterium]|jgi:hypothetical protein|nr:hypothetical protein [Solirubrobacteraceae bacterium]
MAKEAYAEQPGDALAYRPTQASRWLRGRHLLSVRMRASSVAEAALALRVVGERFPTEPLLAGLRRGHWTAPFTKVQNGWPAR